MTFMNPKILLSFITTDGEAKIKTINNVRDTATEEQIRGFTCLYASLTRDTHSKTTILESRDTKLGEFKMNRKLLIDFTTLEGESKTKTFKNVRPEITDSQLREFMALYVNLTEDPYKKGTLVESRDL